jgi:hypothetical protein
MAGEGGMAMSGASAGLDLLGGVFGYFSGEQAFGMAESRANILRMESEAEAQRYTEQGAQFRSSQKLAFLKSGVQLSGSPLDILDQTARVTRENISAIRAQGAARALDVENQGREAQTQGRMALIKGITGGMMDLGKGYAKYSATDSIGGRNNLPSGNTGLGGGGGGGTGYGYGPSTRAPMEMAF